MNYEMQDKLRKLRNVVVAERTRKGLLLEDAQAFTTGYVTGMMEMFITELPKSQQKRFLDMVNDRIQLVEERMNAVE